MNFIWRTIMLRGISFLFVLVTAPYVHGAEEGVLVSLRNGDFVIDGGYPIKQGDDSTYRVGDRQDVSWENSAIYKRIKKRGRLKPGVAIPSSLGGSLFAIKSIFYDSHNRRLLVAVADGVFHHYCPYGCEVCGGVSLGKRSFTKAGQ